MVKERERERELSRMERMNETFHQQPWRHKWKDENAFFISLLSSLILSFFSVNWILRKQKWRGWVDERRRRGGELFIFTSTAHPKWWLLMAWKEETWHTSSGIFSKNQPIWIPLYIMSDCMKPLHSLVHSLIIAYVHCVHCVLSWCYFRCEAFSRVAAAAPLAMMNEWVNAFVHAWMELSNLISLSSPRFFPHFVILLHLSLLLNSAKKGFSVASLSASLSLIQLSLWLRKWDSERGY